MDRECVRVTAPADCRGFFFVLTKFAALEDFRANASQWKQLLRKQ